MEWIFSPDKNFPTSLEQQQWKWDKSTSERPEHRWEDITSEHGGGGGGVNDWMVL